MAPLGAQAEIRVALVVGNAAYQHAPALANPRNDAAGVAAALRRLGFEVQEGVDLDMPGMRLALRDFARRLENADVGLFFYAGHALQVRGQNYLVPVGARLERETDLDFDAIELDIALRLLEQQAGTSLVFLDACRDNPLTRTLARSMGTRSQAVGRGLAQVASGAGTLIAYATQPDNVALDGQGENSPFTAALLAQIETPGLEIGRLLASVAGTVKDQTQGRQVPWWHASLTGDFFFLPPQPEPEAPPANWSDVVVVWDAIKDSQDPADFETFLSNHSDSPFAPYAHNRLKALAPQPRTAAERAREENAAADQRVAALTSPLDERGDLASEIERLSSLLGSAEAGREEREQRMAELSRQLASEQERMTLAQRQVEERDARIAGLLRDTDQVKKELAGEQERMTLAQRQVEERDARIAGLLRDTDQVKKELAGEQERMTLAQRQVEERDARIAGLLRDTDQVKKELAGEQERTMLAQREVADRDRRIEDLLKNTGRMEEALEIEQTLSREALTQVEILNRQINALRAQVAALEQALEIEQQRGEEAVPPPPDYP